MTTVIKERITDLVKQYKTDQEIYHDLMQFRVREILLVATVYDAFILEEEDKLTEKIFGEYYQLNLSTAPRVSSVSTGEEALEILKKRSFDMIILTMRIDEISPFELSEKIRSVNPAIPIILLLNDNAEIRLLQDREEQLKHFDRIFVWNGDSKIFLAIIKYIEDKINVVKDTKIGLVRVILLVEDSIRYYSSYLPILYSEIMKQTQRIISEEHLDEMKKLLRMRARPKVLMAGTYEEALEIFKRYREYLLCIISDVKFPVDGELDENAGVKLLGYLGQEMPDVPRLLQSSDPANRAGAEALNAIFLNKSSPNLSRDLTEFIFNYLGFGDFVFRDNTGSPIDRAQSMDDFKGLLARVPDESLVYHANRNHFSSWLMARGEIQIARKLRPVKVSDFPNYEALRKHLIEVFDNVHKARTRGRVVQYSEDLIDGEAHVVRLTEGSLGGKGRGMAFLHMLIQNCKLNELIPEINIRIPGTSIIGTEEYDAFIERNDLDDLFNEDEDFDRIKKRILWSELSAELKAKLNTLLRHADYPLCARSSGLFEDSLSQPFAGIYDTYLIPNHHPDISVRQKQLEDAVKLVYASVFSKTARAYFDAISYRMGEEKMAVLIQGVVGNRYGRRYYPHISGVAQSYNYYPVAYLKPEDGISVVGIGLGKYVIDGEKAFRFCPKYPKLDFLSPEEQLKSSQQFFYALDMRSNQLHLIRGEDSTLQKASIDEAEKDGTLHHCVSVWDYANDRLQIGSGCQGPKILNFAYLLKYDYFPLARTLEAVLDIVKDAMGTPVEIEFAVDLSPAENGKPSFYILQIKPLLGDLEDFKLDLSEVNREELLLYSERAMGNGTIGALYDVIHVDLERFDKAETVAISEELEKLNDKMKREKRHYLLIGPGRWGTRDRWLGIPVNWGQISNARIIVEVELEDFKIDPSLGSHFFHNITSMNIGYFDIPFGSNSNFIDWEWLQAQPVMERTEHLIHRSLGRPLQAKMDGRKSISVIFK